MKPTKLAQRLLPSLVLAVGLSACGGGGSDSSGGDLVVSFDYPAQTQVQLFASFEVVPTLAGLEGHTPTISIHDLLAGSGLPPGWSVNPRTGALIGVATQTGQYQLGANLTAEGVEGNLTTSFSVQVVSDISISYSGTVPTVNPGSAIPSRAPKLTGVQAGDTLAFAVVPGQTLPSGIQIDTATGTVSGSVPATPAYATYSIPVQMTLTRGTQTATFNAVPGYTISVR